MIRQLPWDSEFFGVRVARLDAPRATPEALEAALAACRAEGVDCLYLLADLGAPATVHAAEQRGFRLVDCRLELERPLGAGGGEVEAPAGVVLRPATENDVPALAAIAARSHLDARFYADPHFPRERCDALYVAWIANSVRGQADRVWLAEVDGRVGGYLSCHVDEAAESGQIGLLAVADGAQGHGVGGLLIEAGLGYFRERGCRHARVVTQAVNVRAQRLYQKFQFRTERFGAWLHWWSSGWET
jgi:dTDP-4-amino-4,6-dideoxy-D-galactose acyltransferase